MPTAHARTADIIDVEVESTHAAPSAYAAPALLALQLPPALHELAKQIGATAAEARQTARRSIDCALECGHLLTRLQEAIGNQHGGNRGNQFAKAPRGALAVSLDQIAEAVGVPARTADRWMALARADRIALRLIDGEAVEVTPDKGEPFTAHGPAHREAAEQWRDRLLAGEVPQARALPALLGSLNHRSPLGDAGRAGTDHLAVWLRGCTALSPRNYDGLIGKQRMVAVERLGMALGNLPLAVREELHRQLELSLQGETGE